MITALPLYHIFSLTANCLFFTKIGGLNVLITNPRDIPFTIKEMRKFKFSALTGVNTLFNALLKHPSFAKLDFSRLRLSLGGGMAVQKIVAEKWQALTHAPLLEAYGLTETSPCVTINPANLKSYNGSVGLPVSSTDVCILDDHGNELPLGERGELAVKGPQVMQGYWHNEEETRKVLTKEGWLLTGDIASIDTEGFVRIAERGVKVRYLHSDIGTVERVEIIRDLRLGNCDCLVGINLLREGLDLPEVSLVAILDADKEGFLRSETALIQTIGRVARHFNGKAILYADQITGSIDRAVQETNRRREKQAAYNKEHHITPRSIQKAVHDIMEGAYAGGVRGKLFPKSKISDAEYDFGQLEGPALTAKIAQLEKKMYDHAHQLEFEEAARLRDVIRELRENTLGK